MLKKKSIKILKPPESVARISEEENKPIPTSFNGRRLPLNGTDW